jgi:hypothetical protein
MRTFVQKSKATQQTTSAKSTIPGGAHFGQSREVNSILHLQGTIGNQAVLRLLQANAEELKAGLTGTAPPQFGHDFSRIPTHPPAVGAIQTKLAINQPGDEYEQEADRVADQVLAAPAHPPVSGALPCIQRFSGQSNGQTEAVPTSVDNTLASPGRHLEPALRQDMEQRFGHDFSRVRVHSGAVAEQSAREVNANAYTMGHDIVFGAGRFTPGTHEGRRLIAHELTHVVQQRSGLQLADGSSPSAATATPVVQRQVPTTTPAAVPLARVATWENVSTAADDKAMREKLDIEWIGSLPDFLLSQIDREFSTSKEDAAFAKMMKNDAGAKKLDSEYRKEKEDLHSAARERLKAAAAGAVTGTRTKAKPVSDKDIDADLKYQTALHDLDTRHGIVSSEYSTKKRTEFKATPVAYSTPKQTVTKPPQQKVRWAEGRMITRTNFMSWALDLFGAAEPAKRHFQSIRKVKDTKTEMFLADAAAKRFEKARAEFESAFPGYTFPNTSNAQALRGFHQEAQGIGMLGHALGLSIDFEAVDQPHQDPSGNYTIAHFMLRTFGKESATAGGSQGRSGMDIAGIEQAVENVGQGKKLDEGKRVIDRALAQYKEMATTSDRFKASMKDQLPTLQAARKKYIEEIVAKQGPVKVTEKALIEARKKAKAHLAKATGKDQITVDDIDNHPLVTPVLEKYKNLNVPFEISKKDILATMKTAFKLWTDELRADITKGKAKVGEADIARAPKLDTAKAAQLKLKVTPANTDKLKQILNNPTYKAIFDGIDDKSLADQLKKDMVARADHMYDAAWERDAITAREGLIRRLETDFRFVLGAGEINKRSGAWQAKNVVGDPAVIQYLERGFVRDDKMEQYSGAAPKERKGVFNHQTAMYLMMNGFSPGAAFSTVDAMHFDFIEGYSVVPGGRSQANIRGRFSPAGGAKKK